MALAARPPTHYHAAMFTQHSARAVGQACAPVWRFRLLLLAVAGGAGSRARAELSPGPAFAKVGPGFCRACGSQGLVADVACGGAGSVEAESPSCLHPSTGASPTVAILALLARLDRVNNGTDPNHPSGDAFDGRYYCDGRALKSHACGAATARLNRRLGTELGCSAGGAVTLPSCAAADLARVNLALTDGGSLQGAEQECA